MEISNSTILKSTLFTLTITAFLFSYVSAHSFLLEPRAYIRGFSPDGCEGLNCKACPPFFKNKKLMNNTEDRPEVTWKRGEKVMIRWAKNNHVGGFVRLAIVPVDKVMDVQVHDLLAFYYGCWEQGLHTCQPDQTCAADKQNKALQRPMTIPDYLPDGVYVFGFIWYGGLHFRGETSQFADYPSCSYIRIQGGNPVSDSFQPYFEAGPLRQFVHRKLCKTYTDVPRFCTGNGCKGTYQAFRSVPKPFLNGQKPPRIYSSYFQKDGLPTMTSTPVPSLDPSTTSSPTPTPSISSAPSTPSTPGSVSPSLSQSVSPSNLSPSASNSAVPIQISVSASSTPSNDPIVQVETPEITESGIPSEEPYIEEPSISPVETIGMTPKFSVTPLSSPSASPSASSTSIPTLNPSSSYSPSPTPSPTSSILNRDTGICKRGVCCASRCGVCKMNNCRFRRGGRNNCCPNKIANIGRLCHEYDAPCIQTTPTPTSTPTPFKSEGPRICTSRFCCASSCGRCGGKGCKRRPGGRSNCCLKGIRNSNRYCDTHAPPCIYRNTPSPTLVNPNRGICNGNVCCPIKCGSCGGSGCANRPGGGYNCCSGRILRSGRKCGERAPPCSLI